MFKTWYRVLVAFAITAIVGVVPFFMLTVWLAARYQYAVANAKAELGGEIVTAKLDALRAAGIPVDYETQDKWYRDHTDPADAQAWQEVISKVDTPEFNALVFGFIRKLPDPESLAFGIAEEEEPERLDENAKRRKILAETADLRKEIRRLARKRVPVQFPIQFVPITKLSHLSALASSTYLAQLEFKEAVHTRNSPEIVESTLTLMDLATIISGETSLTSQLAMCSWRRKGTTALQEALEKNLIDEADLERLAARLLESPISTNQYRDAMRSDRATALPIFFAPRKYLIDADGKIGENEQAAAQDILHYLDFMERIENLGQLPLTEADEKFVLIYSEVENAREKLSKLRSREWTYTLLSLNIHLSIYRNVLYSFTFDRQILNMTLHGIAIRRYQKKFGEFPKDLAALKEVGFDAAEHMPQGQFPMGYRLEGDGAILWSTPPWFGSETTADPITPDLVTQYIPETQDSYWKFAP